MNLEQMKEVGKKLHLFLGVYVLEYISEDRIT